MSVRFKDQEEEQNPQDLEKLIDTIKTEIAEQQAENSHVVLQSTAGNRPIFHDDLGESNIFEVPEHSYIPSTSSMRDPRSGLAMSPNLGVERKQNELIQELTARLQALERKQATFLKIQTENQRLREEARRLTADNARMARENRTLKTDMRTTQDQISQYEDRAAGLSRRLEKKDKMLNEITRRVKSLTEQRNEASICPACRTDLVCARCNGLRRVDDRYQAARRQPERYRPAPRNDGVIQLGARTKHGFDPARLQLRQPSPPRQQFTSRARRARRDDDFDDEIISRRDRGRTERWVVTEDSDSEDFIDDRRSNRRGRDYW